VESATTGDLIPIYTTRGDAAAFLAFPNLFDPHGDWIGWVTAEREVYSVLGHFVGYLSDEPRVLRRRTTDTLRARRPPTAPPARIRTPVSVPLAPLMAELPESVVDVLQDEPERLHGLDYGALKPDLD
jgi:hypothetical protein